MISIIIPVYNKEIYIENTIQSVLSQNFNDFEIIAVDDGSKDSSLEILKKINAPKLKVVHKENGGVSSARNYGIPYAQGDWIMFLDADDEMCPGALAEFDRMTRCYDAKVIVSNFIIVEKNGINRLFCTRKKEFQTDKPMKYQWLRYFWLRPGNTLLHRSVFDNITGYDEHMSYNEDVEFSVRVMQYYKVAYTQECLLKYYKVEGGGSSFVHVYEKDYVSKFKYLSSGDFFVKLDRFAMARYDKRKRKGREDARYSASYIAQNYSWYFPVIYNLWALYRMLNLKLMKYFG